MVGADADASFSISLTIIGPQLLHSHRKRFTWVNHTDTLHCTLKKWLIVYPCYDALDHQKEKISVRL